MLRILIATLFCLPFPLAALAHGGEEHPEVTNHPPEIIAAGPSKEQATPALKETMATLEATINAGKLPEVHKLTEEAATAAKRLEGVDGSANPRLAAAMRQFLARLEALHTASDGGDAAATAAELMKVQSAYRLLEAQQASGKP